jgi:hypothetical protein
MFQLGTDLWNWLGTVPPGVFAITGAIIGVLGNQWYNRIARRPRPLIFVDHLKMNRSERPPGTIIRRTEAEKADMKQLMVQLDENPFVTEVISISSKLDEGEYVNCLERALREIEEALNYVLPSARDVAKDLQNYADNKRFSQFAEIWAREQNIIWPLLTMAVLREDTQWDKNSDAEPYDVDTDDAGDLYIYVKVEDPPPARRAIPFPVSGHRSLIEGTTNPISPIERTIERFRAPKSKQEELKNLAEDTARALQGEKREVLRKLAGSLHTGITKYITRLEGLQNQVQEELKRYNRIMIHGQISNTGGSPFSVLNEGKLFVQTKGHPYTQGDGDDRTQSYFKEDTEIPIVLPNKEKRYDVPVSIAPGDVYRFNAVSVPRFDQLEQPQVLRDIFRAGGKTCYIGVQVILPGRSRRRSKPVQYTTPRIFQDWKTNINVPRQRRPWYSLTSWLLRKLQETSVGQ